MVLIWLSISFIIGTWIGSAIDIQAGIWLGFAAISLAGNWLLKWLALKYEGIEFNNKIKIIFLILISVFIGAARYSCTRTEIDVNHPAWYNDSGDRVYIEGVVYKFPDERDSYTNIYISVDHLGRTESGMHPVEGKILLKVPRNYDLSYGDKIKFRGELRTPDEHEEFSYKSYLERKGVFSLVYYPYIFETSSGYGNPIITWLGEIRAKGISLIYQFLPDPEASLCTGIVLGYEKGIEEDVQKAFRDTGTTHVIAISGANVSVVAGMMTLLFARLLGPRKGALAALIGIVLYAILVGGDAVVVRAAIMGSIGLFAQQIGRRQYGVVSLLITAALMIFVNPDVLWDVGFQLSLAATMGLVLLSEPLINWFISVAERFIHADKLRTISTIISEYFLMTIAAQITTLPLIIYYFERLSFTSLPANSAILPAQPPIMLLGGLSVLAGLIWKPLGQLIAYFVWPFLTYTIRVVEWFASKFRNTIVINDLSFTFVIITFALIFSIIFWREKVFELVRKFKLGWVLIFILVLNLFLWNGIANAPDGNLHINVLDVGSGSAVLIQSPEGRYVLINGGQSSSKVSDGVGRILPLFQQKIDSLVISSCAAEEIDGLAYAVEGFLPGNVLWTCDRSENRASRYLDETLSRLDVDDLEIKKGDIVDLGGGAYIEVMAESDEGTYLMIGMSSFRMLILDNSGIEDHSSHQVNVLLAGQGETEVISEKLISAANPQLVILSLGAGDKQGRPDAEVMDLFSGRSILRTDESGWIRVSTDGENMWVDIEKN